MNQKPNVWFSKKNIKLLGEVPPTISIGLLSIKKVDKFKLIGIYFDEIMIFKNNVAHAMAWLW